MVNCQTALHVCISFFWKEQSSENTHVSLGDCTNNERIQSLLIILCGLKVNISIDECDSSSRSEKILLKMWSRSCELTENVEETSCEGCD